MSKSYYIVSKPLQYFNAINIRDDLASKICLIVDNFYEAETFFNNIKNNRLWSDVIFFASAFDAYKWLKDRVNFGDNLFVDSDHGFRKTIWLSRIKSRNIYVYEEGIGSYRNDLIKSGYRNKLFKFFLKLFGFKEYMGGGAFTKGIIIYDIESHKKLVNSFNKVRIQFKLSFHEHLLSDLVNSDFDLGNTELILERLSRKKVLMYLTDFEYNDKADLIHVQYSDYVKILKPHPNIKNILDKDQYDIILDNSVLIELFIVKVVEEASELIVVHENSSSANYLKNIDKITFINIKR